MFDFLVLIILFAICLGLSQCLSFPRILVMSELYFESSLQVYIEICFPRSRYTSRPIYKKKENMWPKSIRLSQILEIILSF